MQLTGDRMISESLPCGNDYQSIQPVPIGGGYCIAFSQPEAHTKRFNLIHSPSSVDRLLAAHDAASGHGGRMRQALDRKMSTWLWNILWLNLSDTVWRCVL